MRVFVAGASGAIGRFLVPRLVANGHVMTAQRGADSGKARETLGWQPASRTWRDGFPALLDVRS